MVRRVDGPPDSGSRATPAVERDTSNDYVLPKVKDRRTGQMRAMTVREMMDRNAPKVATEYRLHDW